MSNRDALERQLIAHEALRVWPYDDKTGKRVTALPSGGNLTLGVGHNLFARALTRDQCLLIFRDDLAITIGELVTAFPWFERLDPARQAVLVDMAFNLGIPKLTKFAHALAAMAHGHYREASVHMLESDWADQVGNRALTLATMMETGANPFHDEDDGA